MREVTFETTYITTFRDQLVDASRHCDQSDGVLYGWFNDRLIVAQFGHIVFDALAVEQLTGVHQIQHRTESRSARIGMVELFGLMGVS